MSARTQRGYTLTEALVVLALISMAVMASGPLWDETQVVLKRAGEALRQPGFGLAEARLRADVQGAGVLGAARPDWTPEPLLLRWPAGDGVRYEVHEGRLERFQLDGSGGVVTHRVVVLGVSSWQWRAASSRLVDIEVTHAVTAEIRTAGPTVPGESGKVARRTERLRFALRGGGGERLW